MAIVTPKHKHVKHENHYDPNGFTQKAQEVIDKYVTPEFLSESEKANFADTPVRAAKAWNEIYKSDYGLPQFTFQSKVTIWNTVRDILATGFPTEGGDCGIVTQGPIIAESLCPHHLVRVHYKIFVAYKPHTGGTVLGLSKLARLSLALANRPVLQEQLTADIADCLHHDVHQATEPYFPQIASDGSAVQVIGKHGCMCQRGVQSDAFTLTTVLRGAFMTSKDLKNEFYQAVSALRNTRF